ncbi:MAG: transcription-repair coupling factor [Candidatus Izimaplasma sp.]|nr:transcription-repair coupling factor [Candidatus Izimaplasma bacterium]
MKKIINYLSKTPYFQEFMTKFTNNDEIQITNTNDNISILMLLYLFNNSEKNLLVVTPNLYKAQKVYDELINLVNSEILSFFPQDEFVTTEMLAVSKEFKYERISTIKKVIENKKNLVITNTTGLLKYELSRKKWETAILRLSKEDVIDLKELPRILTSYGYKRGLTVEKQGDFSLRGSILDIYPISETKPLRIDFFDDEVDSIRYFDVNTQRSTVQTTSCVIYPVYEFFYTDNELQTIKRKLQEITRNNDLSDKTVRRIEKDILNLENRNDVDKLSRYITFLNDKSETIIDFMDNQVVVYWDYKRVKESYKDVVRDITDWYDTTDDYPSIGFDLIKDINHIYSDKSLYLDVFGDAKKFRVSINVRAKDTVVYNNNIHMAINDLIKYNGYTTVIVAFKSLKSLKKFIDLIDEKVAYHIIGTNDEIQTKRINLIVQEHIISFELFNINTIVLTEENLYKQKELKKTKHRAIIKDAKKLTAIDELKKGDYVVHYDHGIGRFLGIETMTLGKNTNDYIFIQYRGDDSLYIPVENIKLIRKFVGSESVMPKLNKLGSADWAKTKQRVKKRIKDIANRLIKLYAAREEAKGFAFSEDTELQISFEAGFEYQETEDQIKAVEDVKKDMESIKPMDRLLCGDVGYGKTEVALRAAFKAVLDNKQVAYLAPTTMLSRQHYYTFKDRLDEHGIRVELLNRFITKSKQKKILHDIRIGAVDIIIGTHRILSKDMKFSDLGLLIIDEEQRFGVEHKEKIKEFKVNIDVLSLSATPIPRTLQMAIMGVKSMSLLETPPANRYPIQTYVMERNDPVIRDAIERELARNGQSFYLYNRVDDINIIANKVQRLVLEARVCYAHGKMSRIELENVIEAFLDKQYDVLVSTTIIETGIDIPNANTLIIHDSDRLGLSQLYQIRGRVGRSDKIAYAYLMFKKHKQLNEEAMKRLKIIKEFTELGSGFKIAIRDLSIRGAGDVLGTEQSGFMDSVGLDLYIEMLKDEIAVQKGDKEEHIEKTQPIRLGVNKYIDSNYIDNDYIKIEMHRKIANIKSKTDIELLLEELKDRFGVPSNEIILYMYEKLFEYLALQKGIEKVRETKNNVTFVVTKEKSQEINGEYLFMKANDISKFIRFTYRLDRINIIIDTIKLDRHYLYFIVDLLQAL